MPTGSVAALNIKFTADIKGVNKAIREAEKSLKSATQTFSSIGNQLSLALSAPIAAFVGTSVKAAGELESLKLAMRTTFQGAGRSISEADAELEKLREAALAPGLDFEQAVKGSLRLQGVGYSAEKARGILVELANALASVGGTADQLDGVTKQFAQMIGKGKVMQDDLRVILENMPNLAKIIKDEFGVTTAEALRDLGVNADQFVTRLTKRMETLPRVSGGIANSIVNAGNAVKMALANVGESLNKTFNISGKLDQFAEWVSSLAQRFSQLDEGTKRAIAAAATFAFALGPLLKAMQPIIWVAGQVNTGFLNLRKMLIEAQSGVLPGFIARWKAMDVAMKASVIGATVAVVLALAAAFLVLQKDMSAAAQAQRSVEQVSKTAADSIAEEKTRAELLVGVIKSETKTRKEKAEALKELQAISPKYFAGLDEEKAKTTALDTALSGYVGSIMKAAKAKAAFEQIVALEQKRNQLVQESDPSYWQKFASFVASGGNAAAYLGDQAKKLGQNFKENNGIIDAQIAALTKVVDENSNLTQTVGITSKAINQNKGEVDDLAKSYRELDKATKLANREKQTKDLGGFKKTISPTISPTITPNIALPENMGAMLPVDRFKELADSIGIATDKLTNFKSVSEQLGEVNLNLQGGLIGVGEAFKQAAAVIEEHGSLIEKITYAVADAMAQSAASGEASFGKIALAAVGAAAKIIRAQIQEAVAAAAFSALKNVPFPFNIAAAAAAGALASGLFNKLISSVGIPALAQGGVITGPTTALMGEYPNARVNPEIVAPEKKLRDIFRGEMGGRGGGTLTARISGRDLLFVLEQAGYDAKRTRGY